MKLENREMKNKYEDHTDEQVAVMAQGGDIAAAEYLLKKYRPLILKVADGNFEKAAGSDKDDMAQEARIGFFKAITTFDKNKNHTFGAYAKACAVNQVINAVKAANRKKHALLNNSLSLETTINSRDAEHEITIGETIEEKNIPDPEMLAIFNDMIRYINENEKGLFTDLEIKVWNEYAHGKEINDIAKELNKNAKSIYNAMDRLKRKILEYMDD